jgi:hypothetical protein
MSQRPRHLFAKQLQSIEGGIEAIDNQIADDPPDTSDELLQLREIQRMYREIAVSLKGAIAFYE